MNGAVDTSATQHELVRGVHDSVDLKSRNIASLDLQTGHCYVTTFRLTAVLLNRRTFQRSSHLLSRLD